MPIGTLNISVANRPNGCITLDNPTVKIGTDPSAAIQISGDGAEKLHMEIRKDADKFYSLKCFFQATKTGTRLNHTPLRPGDEFRIDHGDVITIGQNHLEFRLLDVEQPVIALEVHPVENTGITAANGVALRIQVFNFSGTSQRVALSGQVKDASGVALKGWSTTFEPETLTVEKQTYADALMKLIFLEATENQSRKVALTVVATWGEDGRKLESEPISLTFPDNGLPLSGGTITGPLTVKGVTTLVGDLTVGGRGTISATENGAATLSIAGDLKLQDGVAVSAFSDDGNLTESNAKTVPTAPAIGRYVDRKIQAVDQAAQAIKADVDRKIQAVDQATQAIKADVDRKIQAVDQEIKRAIDAHASTLSHGTQAIPPGVIMMWSGDTDSIPDGWTLCDGENGTPNLKARFIIGAWKKESVGQTGGSFKVTLGIEHLPPHDHASGDFNRVLKNDGQYSMVPDYIDDRHYEGEIEPNLRYSEALQSVGGGESLDITPPYYALAFIMKV